MKKATLFAMTVLALMAFMAYPIMAGDVTKEVKAEKTADAKSTLTSAKGKTCSLADPSSCATEAKSASATEAVMDGKYAVKTMSVKGMTCAGCENSISAALMQVPGVVEVVSIDHKTGEAVVKVDPAKAVDSELTMAVVNKGYQAEIIPAVAKTQAVSAMACPASGNKAACMKACTADDAAKETKKSLDDTK